MLTNSTAPDISADLLSQYDIAGPRYTSYPTADRFVEAFSSTHYKQALEQRQVNRKVLPLSLYVHIPFCESVCFFCACNKVVTKHHEQSVKYLRYLEKEIDMHVAELGDKQPLTQLHLGGGSPTFFNDQELTTLMIKIRKSFRLSPVGEYSIEIDPRTVSPKRLQYIKSLGFNRLSFGVQDFNPAVQKAVNRVQTKEQVMSLVDHVRQLKFDSLNLDLIYGLPLQTNETFEETLTQLLDIRPDRVALYAYAHLPERFKPQRRIDTYQLPSAAEKISMLSMAITRLLNAGYIYIGMDHFALPGDELAVAKRQGRLHRNFQGYSTQSECDMIGIGVSSIGHIGSTYSQNAKTINDYYDALDQEQFPVVRGLALSFDDMIRRAVIMALMCQGEVLFESIELAYMINFKDYFSKEMASLKALENVEMLVINDEGIEVTEMGWFFVRAIAMTFDHYLQADRNRARFSKIL